MDRGENDLTRHMRSAPTDRQDYHSHYRCAEMTPSVVGVGQINPRSLTRNSERKDDIHKRENNHNFKHSGSSKEGAELPGLPSKRYVN